LRLLPGPVWRSVVWFLLAFFDNDRIALRVYVCPYPSFLPIPFIHVCYIWVSPVSVRRLVTDARRTTLPYTNGPCRNEQNRETHNNPVMINKRKCPKGRKTPLRLPITVECAPLSCQLVSRLNSMRFDGKTTGKTGKADEKPRAHLESNPHQSV